MFRDRPKDLKPLSSVLHCSSSDESIPFEQYSVLSARVNGNKNAEISFMVFACRLEKISLSTKVLNRRELLSFRKQYANLTDRDAFLEIFLSLLLRNLY